MTLRFYLHRVDRRMDTHLYVNVGTQRRGEPQGDVLHVRAWEQCDQNGRYFKVLGEKVACKSSPNIEQQFWAIVKWHSFYIKLMLILFGQLLEKIWLLFIPSNWSYYLGVCPPSTHLLGRKFATFFAFRDLPFCLQLYRDKWEPICWRLQYSSRCPPHSRRSVEAVVVCGKSGLRWWSCDWQFRLRILLMPLIYLRKYCKLS